MTTITIEDVEFDLEQFATQLKVFERYVNQTTPYICNQESAQWVIDDLIKGLANENTHSHC